MAKALNHDVNTLTSSALKRFYRQWLENGRSFTPEAIKSIFETHYPFLVTIELCPGRPLSVRYNEVGPNCQHLIEIVGHSLTELGLPSEAFFLSAYEAVARWNEPVFGWDAPCLGDPIYEFALLPVCHEGHVTQVVAIEELFGLDPKELPDDYKPTKIGK